MAFAIAVLASVGAFEFLVSLLADFEETFLLWKLYPITRLNQVDFSIILHSLCGNAITFLLLNVNRCSPKS